MKILFVVVVLLALAAAILAAQAKRAKAQRLSGNYRRRELMTDNELEFFGRLVVALPDHYIFPQVAMSAVLEAADSDKNRARSDRLRIAQQRIDYVIATKRGDIVAVVELDDKMHARAKDELRDARLAQAGIKTVRFQSRSKPGPAAILVAVLGPATGHGEPQAGGGAALRST